MEEPAAEEKRSEKETTENKSGDAKESDKKTKNETTGKNTTEKEAAKDLKPKMVTLKEPIKASEEVLMLNVLNKKQFDESIEKIKKLDRIEHEINRRATALNNLESFVIEIQNKLYEDEYIQAGTEAEIEKIKTMCNDISDWLYDEGSEADADTYEKKLDELHELTRELFSRVWEHKERPEALKALHSMLNHSSHFLISAKNLTKGVNPEKDVFTDVEINTLEKLINDTTDWRDKAVKEQNELKPNEPIKLTVKMLMDKMAALDREVKYLVNKIKMWRPKKTEKPADDKNSSSSGDKDDISDNGENIVEEDAEIQEETIEAPKTEENINPTPSDEQPKDSHTEL